MSIYIYRERERGRHPHKTHSHLRELCRKVTRSLQSNCPIVFNKPPIRKCTRTGEEAPGHSHEFAISIQQTCEGNCPGGPRAV